MFQAILISIFKHQPIHKSTVLGTPLNVASILEWSVLLQRLYFVLQTLKEVSKICPHLLKQWQEVRPSRGDTCTCSYIHHVHYTYGQSPSWNKWIVIFSETNTNGDNRIAKVSLFQSVGAAN